MEKHQVLRIGYPYIQLGIEKESNIENYYDILSGKSDVFLHKLLRDFADYFVNYTKKFDSVSLYIAPFSDDEKDLTKVFLDRINQSEIDILFDIYPVNRLLMQYMDFAYPYKLFTFTFVIPKPEYQPQVFGIFQTVSLSVWITIFSVFIAVLLIHCVIFKSKYSFEKIFLNVFAVFLRQSSIVNPTSVGKKLLIYSWVVGAMFLCLAYDSVFLSFLSFPPVNKIRTVSALAEAVEKKGYQCVSFSGSPAGDFMLELDQRKYQIVGKCLNKNIVGEMCDLSNYLRKSKKINMAYFPLTEILDLFDDDYFVAKETFLNFIAGMGVRKNFCCIKDIRNFVHKMMSSGLYRKYQREALLFLRSIYRFRLSAYDDTDTSDRELTLTDVAPAFIFLLLGYFVSLLVFIGEMIVGGRIRFNCFEKIKKVTNRSIHNENPD